MHLQIIHVTSDNPNGKVIKPRVKKLVAFSDPGHAWLRVPTNLATQVNAVMPFKISQFSYKSPTGRFLYLEEDCDAGSFLNAAKAFGLVIEISSKNCANRESKIRQLERAC